MSNLEKGRQGLNSSFSRVRALTISAVFSDDLLFEQVALKGGNALTLAFGLSDRTSLDLDFSIEADFADAGEVAVRLQRALSHKFLPSGYVVFDYKFEARPRKVGAGRDTWGGYEVTFKLSDVDGYLRDKDDLEKLRRSSFVTGPLHARTIKIDLSKYEYTSGKVRREFNDSDIYVYSPRMIALEKLRALCQQLPEYEFRKMPRPRARDFYDIHILIQRADVYLPSIEALELAKLIFGAKEVPLKLLSRLRHTREFHRPDWEEVMVSSAALLYDFDYYFDFTCTLVESLESAWNI